MVVFANRCGRENDVTYAGSSMVASFDNGKIHCSIMLGKADERGLVVDTDDLSIGSHG